MLLFLSILFVLYVFSLCTIWNISNILTLRIYLLSNAFYFILVPLEWFINALINNGKGSDFDIEATGVATLCTMAVLSLWGMFLPLHFFKFSEQSYLSFSKENTSSFSKIAFLIALFLLFSLFLFNYNTLISINNYREGLKVLFANPIISVALSSILILSFVSLFSFIDIKKNLWNKIIVTIPFLLIGLGLKSKDELVWGVFIFWILIQYTTTYGKPLFYCIIVALVLSPILNWLFIGWRLEGMGKVLDIISHLDARNFYFKSDPGGILFSFTETYKAKESLHLSYGVGYLKELIQLVPKFIYPNRPEDISILFSKTRIEDWTPGFGLGYSPMAEAYQNFGILGGFIHFFILGSFWVFFWKSINQVVVIITQKKLFVSSLYLTIAGLWWFSLPRMPMVAIYKNTFIYCIPFVLLYLVLSINLFAKSPKLN